MALLTVPQVAEMLGFSESWVRKMVDSGQIPHVRLGGGLRFREDDINTWVDSNAHGPQSREK